MEIYKKEWGNVEDPDETVIDADVLIDGSIRISGTDYGRSGRNFSGNEDYDHRLRIPADQISQFTLELLKRGFNLKRPLTMSKVEKLCNIADIKFDSLR